MKATAGSRLILAPEAIAEHSSFLIKSFILNMYENDSEGFDFLETVVKGRLLANVLFFPDISNVNQRIKKLDLYLDTRLNNSSAGLGWSPFSSTVSRTCRCI